ncbi:hypothetical protein [Kutzneria sp. 744]|uniref:hypothetical protein n=1 Tax=Kutzneria sp. (strain 744) TaxID=345341 RepID=UPI0004B4B3E3|nr:hypothetical protein [Kutzneria sp. 744]
MDLVERLKAPGRRVRFSELAAPWRSASEGQESVQHHDEEAAPAEPEAQAVPDPRGPREPERTPLDVIAEVTHVREVPLAGLGVDGLRLRESETEALPGGSHFEVVGSDGVPVAGVSVTPRERGGFVVSGHGVGALHFAADGRFVFRSVELPGADRVVRFEAPSGVARPRLAERDGLPSGQGSVEFVPVEGDGLVVRLPGRDGGEWHLDADGRVWRYELPLTRSGADTGERAVYHALPPLPDSVATPGPDVLWLRSTAGPDGEARLEVVDATRSPVPDRAVWSQPHGGVTIAAAAGDVRWNLDPECSRSPMRCGYRGRSSSRCSTAGCRWWWARPGSRWWAGSRW